MTHDHNPIDALKAACQQACHERHACPHGYKELMSSTTATEIATVWRRYWRELISEQYADIICSELPHHYAELKRGFNQAEVYFNECPKDYMTCAFVLIGNSDEPVHIYGYAKAHILGNAYVIAHDHARVSCYNPEAKMELLDYSEGSAISGYAIARNRSSLTSFTDCESYDASNIVLLRGTLTDHGHIFIAAYNESVINSFTDRKITLHNKATLNSKL